MLNTPFALFLSAIILSTSCIASENYKRQTVERIFNHLKPQPAEQHLTSFQAFALSLPSDLQQRDIIEAIKQNDYSPLSQQQQNQIFRLLGIYSQLKYGNQAIDTLKELVAIPTFKTAGIPSHQSPAMLKHADKIKNLAHRFGLEFTNFDNRIYVVNIPDNTIGSNIALHAHADVVPVNPSSWVLDDGTQLDPFKLTIIGDRMYGRGTEDDKNGIVATLYALRTVKEENIKLLNQIKLIIDTTEESGADAIRHYLKKNPTPDYNLALDGGYPIVIAEKGYGTLMATFPTVTNNDGRATFINVTGGLASNQIPKTSIAILALNQLSATEATQLNQELKDLAKQFVSNHGSNFSIAVEQQQKAIKLTLTGVSAHSSSPGSGINPVSRMLVFIDQLHDKVEIAANHITDAAQYAADNFGLDNYGKKLNVAYSDVFMGPLTMALTLIEIDSQKMRLAVNSRAPKGKTVEQLKNEVSRNLDDWKNRNSIKMSFTYTQRTPMYRDPQGKWVNALLDIATENLNLPREFRSSGGTTSIHNLPNGVQFGLSMPNVKYTGHNANEFKRIDQFMLDLRIVTETIARLGSMEQL